MMRNQIAKAENVGRENDEIPLSHTPPQQDYSNLLTTLNQKYTEYKHRLVVQKKYQQNFRSPLTLLQKIVIFRFIKRLKEKSGNVSIDSVQQHHLALINDLSSQVDYYRFRGSSISRLIKQQYELVDQLSYFSIIMQFIIESIPIFQPNSKGSVICDFLILLISLIQLIQVPLFLTFKLDNIVNQYLIYLVLTIDCFRTLLTGIYVEGTLTLNKIIIFKNYFQQKSEFFLDTITIFQFWIFQDSYFLRLLFLFRFIKLNLIIQKIEIAVNIQNQNLITLIKSIFILIYCTHLMCCYQNMIEQAQKKDWSSVYPIGITIVDNYLQGLYWAVETMVSVGYGDINPNNVTQMIYTSTIMFFGCCLFGYVVNSIGNVLNILNENRKEHSRYKKQYESYYNSKPLTRELHQIITNYKEISYEFRQQSQNYGKEILRLVSKELQLEFIEQVNGKIINNNSFFSKFSHELQKQVIDKLEEKYYLPTDFIAKDTKSIFILWSGSVKLQLNSMIIEHFKDSNYCINLINFITETYEQGQFISTGHTFIYQLNEIKIQYSQDQELFNYIKDDLIFNKNFKIVNFHCPICISSQHLIQHCPEIHFIPNIKKILRMKNLQECQQRQQYIRQFRKCKFQTFIYLNKTQIESLLFIEDALLASETKIQTFNNLQYYSSAQLSQNQSQQQLNISRSKSIQRVSQIARNSTLNHIPQNNSSSAQLSVPTPSLINNHSLNFLNESKDKKGIDDGNEFESLQEYQFYFPNGNISNICKIINNGKINNRSHVKLDLVIKQVMKRGDTMQISLRRQKIKNRQLTLTKERELMAAKQHLIWKKRRNLDLFEKK